MLKELEELTLCDLIWDKSRILNSVKGKINNVVYRYNTY